MESLNAIVFLDGKWNNKILIFWGVKLKISLLCRVGSGQTTNSRSSTPSSAGSITLQSRIKNQLGWTALICSRDKLLGLLLKAVVFLIQLPCCCCCFFPIRSTRSIRTQRNGASIRHLPLASHPQPPFVLEGEFFAPVPVHFDALAVRPASHPRQDSSFSLIFFWVVKRSFFFCLFSLLLQASRSGSTGDGSAAGSVALLRGEEQLLWVKFEFSLFCLFLLVF